MKHNTNTPREFSLQPRPLTGAIRRGLAYGTVVAVSSAVATSPVLAQERSERLLLEEVVVTAQKREQSLQDVPLAVTAFSADKIDELGIGDFADYALQIPSLSFKSFGNPGGATI